MKMNYAIALLALIIGDSYADNGYGGQGVHADHGYGAEPEEEWEDEEQEQPKPHQKRNVKPTKKPAP